MSITRGANAGGAWYPVLTGATPENPPSGQLRMYGKTSSPSLFMRDTLGNEYELRPADAAVDSSILYNQTESYALRVLIANNFR